MFSATFSDEIRRLSRTILRRPGRGRGRPAEHRRVDAIRQIVYPVDRERKEELLAHLIRKRRPPPGARVHPDEDRRDPPRDVARPAGAQRRRDPQRSLAAGADPGARGVQDRRDPGARRDGRRRPRPRHRGPAPRRELRAAVEPAGLHPPDRPDGPGRARRARRSASSASTRPTCCAASSDCSGRRSPGRSRTASIPDRERRAAAAPRRAGRRRAARRAAGGRAGRPTIRTASPSSTGRAPRPARSSGAAAATSAAIVAGAVRPWPVSPASPRRARRQVRRPASAVAARSPSGRRASKDEHGSSTFVEIISAPGKKKPSIRSASTRSTT